ncbi:MAG: ribose-phosphate diphosphokinase [Holosporaceae bacterium]|jgi:ribose-phosphate pyrophosphokinase|nr:ribose-phosphate diphosphokinase [Holosporaceae bacterium]
MEIICTENSKELAKNLAKELSFPIYNANVRRFHNNEISILLPKRFRNVIVVASTVKNDDWIELFLLLDALKESQNLILVMPYMGYGRQDVQNRNESFGLGLFSRLLDTMRISNCIICDNHTDPIMRTPVIHHISAAKIFETDIVNKYDKDRIVVVSPDVGGVSRASAISRNCRCNFALCNKVRDIFGELKEINVIGNVAGKICVLIDDIIDTGGTLCHAANSLMQAGGKGVVAYATHGVLSSPQRLEESKIAEITLTDSIDLKDSPQKFRKLSIVSLIAEAIRYII